MESPCLVRMELISCSRSVWVGHMNGPIYRSRGVLKVPRKEMDSRRSSFCCRLCSSGTVNIKIFSLWDTSVFGLLAHNIHPIQTIPICYQCNYSPLAQCVVMYFFYYMCLLSVNLLSILQDVNLPSPPPYSHFSASAALQVSKNSVYASLSYKSWF